MITLFEKDYTSSAFKNRLVSVKKEINNLTNEQICNTSLDELEDYYFDKFKINLIELFLENINKEFNETTIEEYNPFYNSGDPYEPKYYHTSGYNIIYEIPFDGDSDLLFLRPTTYLLTRFTINNIICPTENDYGKIIFYLSLKKNDFQDHSDNLNNFVDGKFKSKFNSYITMINYLNNDAKNFNSELMSIIKKLLTDKLKSAEDYFTFREKLNIPLHTNPNAPNTKPILLKKKSKTKTKSFPKQKIEEKEYTISDYDYNNIKNIINLSCISMEKTARTFSKLLEEELRDVILSNLNTHYQGTATGETFNKIGKTDINIPFENKSAYIAECKIWHGIKKFSDAINQLVSYTTWRDVKTSLVIFNKDNKDFTKILDSIDNSLKETSLCINRTRINNHQWQCTFKKNTESTELIEINIAIYDLAI